MLFARIKAALAGDTAPANPEPERPADDDAQVACAALLVEAAVMDQQFDLEERSTILALLQRRFEIAAAEAEELLKRGRTASEDASSHYRFTRTINDSWDEEARTELIYLLWSVAYADGRIHPYEDMLIRRIAGLLHVSDRARGDARKRAVASLQSHSAPSEDCR